MTHFDTISMQLQRFSVEFFSISGTIRIKIVLVPLLISKEIFFGESNSFGLLDKCLASGEAGGVDRREGGDCGN